MRIAASIPLVFLLACATERPTRWYGWQTLAADVASVALPLAVYAAGGSSSDSQRLATPIGVAMYALGAPAVHWFQGHRSHAGGSFALRLALPSVAASIGYAAAGPCREDPHVWFGCMFHGMGEAAAGATVGVAAAMATDAAWLAWDDVEEAPAITADLRPGMIGVRGTF